MTDAAREYGSALYELCAGEGLAEEVLGQLQALHQLLAEYPDWLKVLASPTIAKAQRTAAAEQALQGRVHPYVLNFVRLLIDANRIEELDGCTRVYQKQYNEANGILEVCAVTAVPLSEAQAERLKQKLETVTQKTVQLRNRVDAACMGGIRLEMEGHSIDGSVRAQLEMLRRQLLASMA